MGSDESRPLVSSRSFADQGELASVLADREADGALEAQSPELADLGVDSKAELIGFWSKWNEALQSLEEVTDEAEAAVLVAPQNRVASLLQSHLAEQGGDAALNRPLDSGGLEVKYGKDDWWGWFKSVFKWNKLDRHPQVRPPVDAPPEEISDRARIAVFGDWATDLYGAPVVADSIRQDGDFQLVMHLGDVYYSGTRKEAASKLLAPWPKVDGAVSRSLNANHDMYAGGHAYFDDVLPALGQGSSYFALQNEAWTLIALDTGYDEHDLDKEQTEWVYKTISRAGSRRVVLFSHHQLFSRLGSQGNELATKLSVPLANRRIHAWYWGHEHRCVVYEPHPFFGLRGRCIGHGGMPEKRKNLRKYDQEKAGLERSDQHWRRLDAKYGAPSGLILDGPNEHIEGEEEKFLPHGYVVLELDGARLNEVYYSADGRKLLEGPIA